MNRLLRHDYDVSVKTEDYLALERSVLNALEFDLQFVSPLLFLDRYQRIFGLDLEGEDTASEKVGGLARDFCLFMQREASFLEYRPSQVAAAALILGVRTHFFRHASRARASEGILSTPPSLGTAFATDALAP